jgi:tRNA pseudouridine32 synthase / 23S rRNA pseudouridine746 synthase
LWRRKNSDSISQKINTTMLQNAPKTLSAEQVGATAVFEAVFDRGALAHLDEHCLVAVKPSGLLSVPGRGEQGFDCFSRRVQAEFADALVVHRLDMSTSGLMLFARGPSAQRSLSMAFEQRQVHKRYVAVVHGHLAQIEGEINLPLMADWPHRPKQKVDFEQGRPSITRYQVLPPARGKVPCPHTTRLLLEPVTGRAHQLRVHLMALGHPILGDALYAPPDVQKLAPRLLLHACELRFCHPVSGAEVDVCCRTPF